MARFTYDDAHRPLTADYGNGVTLSYEYGDEEQWTVLEGPTVGRYEREFSSTGRLVRWTLPSGDTYRRRYDGAGRVTVETDPLGNRTLYAYDAAGRLETITDEATGGVTTMEYDAADNVTRRIDSEGNDVVYTYEDGELVAMTDQNGHTWQYESSPTASRTTDPLLRTTTQNLSPLGLPTSTSYPGGASTSSTFDGTASADEASRFPLTETDEEGRVRTLSYGSRSQLSGASWPGRTELWSYTYEKTGLGDVGISPEGGSPSLGLFGGRQDPFGYGGQDPDLRGESPLGMEQMLGHRLASITTPLGDVTSWTFDDQGRTTRIDYPWVQAETFTYGADGEVDTQTLADGTVLTFAHDAAMRETARTSTTGHNRSTVYGPEGRVASVTGPTGTVTYGYDPAGRMTSIDTPAGGSVRTAVEYEYDTLGRATAVVVVVGSDTYRTTYGYDGLGNVTSMTDVGTGGTTTWTFDAVGRPASRSTPNGVTTTWTYDARDRVLSVVHERTASSTVLASRTYARTLSGEPTRIDREDGTYVVVGYDSANRVASETHYDPSDAVQTTIAYTYDADGNRATRTVDGVTETYVYGPGAQLEEVTVGGVASATYAHDDAGRNTDIVRGALDFALEFDPDGNVVGIDDGGLGLATYTFDGEGRRERVVHGGVERRYLIAPAMGDGYESPHAVVDASGNLVARWVYAGEHAVMRVSAAGVVTYFLRDPMGTVLGTADSAGASQSVFHYDAFGNVLVATGPDSGIDPAILGGGRFQGMWLDSSGLYFVRARSYDAISGRFLSRDPLAISEREARRVQAYSFAGQNGHVFRDPSGLTIATSLAELSYGFSLNLSFRIPSVTTGLRVLALALSAACAAQTTANFVGLPSGPETPCNSGYYLINSLDDTGTAKAMLDAGFLEIPVLVGLAQGFKVVGVDLVYTVHPAVEPGGAYRDFSPDDFFDAAIQVVAIPAPVGTSLRAVRFGSGAYR